MYKLKHLTIAISLAFASITAPYGVFAAENAVASSANQGTEPVSYTHLDVYKRQFQTYAHPSCG